MKKLLTLIAVLALLYSGPVFAAGFVSGSTGADGAFNPAESVELQLPPDGIFNFTTVDIPVGVTVSFKRNAANTPVYILATGDITIAGTLHVNGDTGEGIYPGKGGPGGYDGGTGGLINLDGGSGLGPGGGAGGAGANSGGKGGDLVSNDRIIPMTGGSGGGGGLGDSSKAGGGGGGGAGGLLIAATGKITINGSVTASGGAGVTVASGGKGYGGGGGSGGTIKLIANEIAGDGQVVALGGGPGAYWGTNGGEGRIRLEFNKITRTVPTSPAYTFGTPGTVFYVAAPDLRIASIGSTSVPSVPGGLYNAPDITLPSTTTNPVTVSLSASNVPVGTVVTVSAKPQYGIPAEVQSTPLSGSDASSTATASVTLSTDYPSVIMAYATFTVQTAMYYEGEKIERVKVASTMGKGSEAVYITESGREIKAEALMAGLR